MVIINIGVRRGWATQASNDFKNNPSFFGGLLGKDQQTPIGIAKVPSTGKELDTIAQYLLEHETMDGQEFAKVFEAQA